MLVVNFVQWGDRCIGSTLKPSPFRTLSGMNKSCTCMAVIGTNRKDLRDFATVDKFHVLVVPPEPFAFEIETQYTYFNFCLATE